MPLPHSMLQGSGTILGQVSVVSGAWACSWIHLPGGPGCLPTQSLAFCTEFSVLSEAPAGVYLAI